MGITASEIRKVGFEHSLRGYDIEQVDVFLEKVAVAVDEMNRRIDELEAQASGSDAAEARAADVDAAAGELAAGLSAADSPVVDAEDMERVNARAVSAESDLAEAQARLREAEQKAVEARQRIEELEAALAQQEDRERIISDAFISAQRSAEQLKEEARAEGERIYRESESKARDLIREALVKKQQVFSEIDVLETSRDQFRKEYKSLLERFAAEADTNFSGMQPAVIPESIVNELMPQERLAVGAAGASDGLSASAGIPGFGDDEEIPPLPTVEMDSKELETALSPGDLDIEDVD